ncbi:MAG: hypothetical protein J6O49_03125 [Bacteroidaceae bacterium]|nr:hypothetical protein [Bacteroidaceae bacterium]
MGIKIEDTEVFGWRKAIKGARNPMNSWEKSDSRMCYGSSQQKDLCDHCIYSYDVHGPWNCDLLTGLPGKSTYIIGPNDHKLLMNLCKGGTEEAKWRRMVHVQMDVTAPLYWWKEFETYKVGTVSNSCSTMHKIQAKEFTLDDFSCEHLIDHEDIEWPEDFDADHPYNITGIPVVVRGFDDNYHDLYFSPKGLLNLEVEMFNKCRDLFLKTKDKKYWWQMIQLLPTSYNQRRTIDLNYEVLVAQYRQRKDHKLDEWHQYCDWIKTLPYSEFITMEET